MHVRSITKKLKFKRNQCSGDSELSANGVRARRQVLCSRRAHIGRRFKYTISEHVHSRGMNIPVRRSNERDHEYFLSIWIDSRLLHIRNRVTQRLIWLLKIEGLFVGMLSAPRFPGLLAHWAFFGDSRFGTTTDGKRLIDPVLQCYNKSYGYWN